MEHATNRVSLECVAANWWLRSAVSGNTNNAGMVNNNGDLNRNNVNNKNGARPASLLARFKVQEKLDRVQREGARFLPNQGYAHALIPMPSAEPAVR